MLRCERVSRVERLLARWIRRMLIWPAAIPVVNSAANATVKLIVRSILFTVMHDPNGDCVTVGGHKSKTMVVGGGIGN